MATEYGLFNDEGCVEAAFFSVEEAEEALEDDYNNDDELEIAEVCPEHEGHRRDYCEICTAE